MQKSLENHELRVTEPDTTYGRGSIPFRRIYIYNPRTLSEQTRDSELVPPYLKEQDLLDWIDTCKQKGVSVHAILGKIYSFPESAIRDFLKSQQPRWLYQIIETIGIMRRRVGSSIGTEFL